MDIERRCNWCGKTFIAHSYGTRYCCLSCKRDAKKSRTKERIEAENSTVATVPEIGVLGNKPFLTPKDVAVLFETTTTSIYRYIYQGLIKAVKLSENKIVIRRSDIDSLFDNAPAYKKNWYTATFNDANSVIKLNDKDLGCIIGQGYVEGIAGHAGGTNSYVVSIRPIIKTDIKEGKVRVTYTVPAYSVVKMIGGGIMGAMDGTVPTRSDQTWPIDQCFPFAAKDSHKKTSSKALVMAHAYSNVIMDKIEEAVKNGVSGNEGDDW